MLTTLWHKVRSGNWVLLTTAEMRWLVLALVFVLAGLLWLLFETVEPPPPKVVRISTGATSGAYFQFGQQYATRLAEHGVKLEVLESSGSVENLQRLNDPERRVDFALVQSGVSDSGKSPEATGLASVGYEPVWVFLKPAASANRLSALVGRSIAIGVAGSGAQVAALELLSANGINRENTQLLELSGSEALSALNAARVDAVIMVAAVSAPLVRQALDSRLPLLSFEQADAYVRRFAWLSKVVLPKGSADLINNHPPTDVQLVATSANLVAREDVHPAISFLMLDVAAEVHGRSGLLHGFKEFPNERNLDFAQSDESKRYFKTGRPFLQRFMPFWLANLLERLMVSVAPVLMLLIPALKLVPAYKDWREKSKILQLYDQANICHQQAERDASLCDSAMGRINVIEQSLPDLRLGASRHIDLYNLKSHLDLVRARIQSLRD